MSELKKTFIIKEALGPMSRASSRPFPDNDKNRGGKVQKPDVKAKYQNRIQSLVKQVNAACDNPDKMAAGSEVNRLCTEFDIVLGQLAQELMQ